MPSEKQHDRSRQSWQGEREQSSPEGHGKPPDGGTRVVTCRSSHMGSGTTPCQAVRYLEDGLASPVPVTSQTTRIIHRKVKLVVRNLCLVLHTLSYYIISPYPQVLTPTQLWKTSSFFSKFGTKMSRTAKSDLKYDTAI